MIDYTQIDYTRGDVRYDVIVDLVANRSLRARRRVLNPRGALVVPTGVGSWHKVAIANLFTRQALRPLVHVDRKEDSSRSRR